MSDSPTMIQPDVPERGLFSLTPAERWEEALLCGNGTMGALAMSQPFAETLVLTHERLFVPLRQPRPPVDTAGELREIRRLIREGKYKDAAEYVNTLKVRQGYPPELIWVDPFMPACDMVVRWDGGGAVDGYRRSLDYRTGVARVQWTSSGAYYQQRTFVSRADSVVVVELTCSNAEAARVEVQLREHPRDVPDTGRMSAVFTTGVDDPEVVAVGNLLTYRCRYKLNNAGYECAARVTSDGGRLAATGASVAVENASRVLVVTRIEPTDDYDRQATGAITESLKSLDTSFDALLARHVAIHGELFDRVSLDLGGGADRQLPAEELWAATRDKTATPALLERVFDAGRYEILASSGGWPPNLQGIWAGSWNVAWMAAYTLNGNTPSAISNCLNGNMPELLDGLFGYFDERMAHFRENARRQYGADGILIPAHATNHGYNISFNEVFCHNFWTAGAGWYAHFYYDYYRYTGDREFLAHRALPFMKDVAAFYESFLCTGADGFYEFNPSYSPENTPDGGDSQAAINATMDVAVCRRVLDDLIEACGTLGVEPENVAKWRAMRQKLPAYLIGADGELKEWCRPELAENHDHRHCSHFFGMWHRLAPDIREDPKLLAACRRAIELRAAGRKCKGGVMGFGAVQIGLAAAAVGDADSVWFVLDRLATGYYYRTFASSHNSGPEVFNADIAGGLPAVMIDMLVMSDPGEIHLLPALPAQLPTGRIVGVPCRGQVVIDELRWSPGGVSVTLRSAIEQVVELFLPSEAAEVQCDVPVERSGTVCRVTLRAACPVTMAVRFGESSGM